VLIINLDEARPGMRLAGPVAHPENPQHDLLKQGYVIEDTILPRLRDLGINALYVDFPGLDDLDRHLAPQLSPSRQTMYQQIRDTMLRVQGRTAPGVAFPDYYAVTRDMVTTLMSQGAHPVYMERMSALGPDAVAHATTVAHIALIMGLRLESYLIRERARLAPQHAKEVVNLGVAGMLHDIGKMRLSEALQRRCETDPQLGAEHADARRDWEAHPRIGYEMLRGGIESSAAAAVLHHHQHFDGTGFPAPEVKSPVPGKAAERDTNPPRGQSIHVFARILYVADLYANLVRPPGEKIRRGNLEVLHILRTQYASVMDPVVFKTLEAVAPPFLPGSKVVLGDQTTAAVVGIRPTDPYVPVVRRLKPDGAELDGPDLDLRQADAPPLVALAGGAPVADFLPPKTEAAAVCAA
jgi:HD-GYP domain-containing protein (c-di-GMP phosphodiesterase class II)